MAKSKPLENENQGLSIGKIVIIVILVFTFVPISVLSILYFTNENFKYIANGHLGNAPGAIGKYFQSFPTRDEREAQKRNVANYLLDLDTSRAADKLILIKKEDNALFSDLIKIMSEKNAKKTEPILELIRDNSIKKDILTSTIEQINSEKKLSLSEQAKYYETLSAASLVQEINRVLMDGAVSFRDMGLIIEQMNEKIAVSVLNNLDEEMALKILSNFDSLEKGKKLQEIVAQMKDKERSLVSSAQIYNTELPEKLINDLGQVKKYKLEELSVLYRNMSILQGAQILSRVEDKDFKLNLLNKIKEDEIVREGNDLVTSDLIKATKMFEEYNRKISDLVNVYKKMEPQQIADLISKLYKNNNGVSKYSFENGESFNITDKDLAIEVLRKLSEKVTAQVLAGLDADLASEISKSLALPKEKI
ncbi:flagellar motility protein MotE (MotC chaperone) [Anaerosolibacter carboniphilus]|uniref:Flagellar motility protein MotE (MotC chaperone) n=1 Tax=Anaerosolibacter carboniphilus TaxID=1417629 RepID=A0A841KSC6_9FIRM|nr:hypothetical protein [Anaerosolibacter carboniphilus]MBB6216476.1 flagellar motility protein MotE (MotC chaperone) [Anaerosolibacter carboniphilus]